MTQHSIWSAMPIADKAVVVGWCLFLAVVSALTSLAQS